VNGIYKYLTGISSKKKEDRRKKIEQRGRDILVLSSVFYLLSSFFTTSAQAEGSRDLFPADATGNRAELEWRTSTYGAGNTSLLRRTLIQVYANAGEEILLGSSAVGIGSGDIAVFDPGRVTGRVGAESVPTGSPNFSCATQGGGNGRIANRTQELAGPGAGYTPCTYTAPVSGVYYVAFYGPSGPNSDVQANVLGQLNFTQTPTGTNVAAWDVTVRTGPAGTTIPGRVFSDYLTLFTGDNGRPINSSYFLVTSDGYQYRTDLNGIDPNGFVIYANNVGYLDSNGEPLFRNVLGNNGNLSSLQGGTSLALPTHKVFFSNPTSAAGANQTISAINIPLAPTPPQVTAPSFSGSIAANNSAVGAGGTFNFNSNVTGNYQIIISRDGTDFDPTNPSNTVLRGLVRAPGAQAVTWDGLANDGTPFPVGQNYQVRINVTGGEIHFPLIDAENSTRGGPAFTLLNAANPLGNSTAFYDDRGYRTANGTVVGTVNGPACPAGSTSTQTQPGTLAAAPFNGVSGGFNSTSSQRAWGTATGGNTNASCTGNFGDAKGLDIWTFFPSEAAVSPLNIIDQNAGTIGDTVFRDENGNQVQDPGEPGIPEVVVTLTLPDGTTRTTTTDADGRYRFTGLPPGINYRVSVATPAGLSPTNTVPAINLNPQQNVDTADFGFRPARGSIGDTVFRDDNGNGQQDTGEPGIPNITVTTTLPDGTTRTATTDPSGRYIFNDLPPGSYTITPTSPPGFLLTTNNPTVRRTLTAGQNITNVDFGLQQRNAAIGDVVFNDVNGNGQQDPGEPGLPNVTLTLRNSQGTVVGTTTTSPDGVYSFTGLPAGNYTVVTTPPTDFNYTTDTTLGPNPRPVNNLTPGEQRTTVDFGFQQRNGSIGDRVFNDINRNGVQDPGEPGIGGATVTLTVPGTPTPFATTTTDPNGNYTFNNLPLGNFNVTVSGTPAGFTPTTTPPSPVTLTPAAPSRTDVDFGFALPNGSIGDRVFNDANGNGVQDPGEPGISGAVVTLTPIDRPPQTTTTDANGNYTFGNLPDGTYTVAVTQLPPGFTPPPTVAPPGPITLSPENRNIDNADFGFRQPTGSIGTTVFNDLNGNGVQDPGERGIPGATVILRDANGTEIRRTTTDPNGAYLFPDVPNGNYRVEVAGPTGLTLTTNNQNLPVNLSPTNPNFPTANFGFRAIGTISDRVFLDPDGNGQQNPNDPQEPGLPGITVVLRDANGTVIATTTTNENGDYSFTNLPVIPAQQFTVEVVDPLGLIRTTPGPQPVTLSTENPSQRPGITGLRGGSGPIGDTVFNDLNGDGTQDPVEPGIPNVTVTLRDANGNVITTTTTNASGNYLFSNLPPASFNNAQRIGRFTVEITPPPGFPTFTTDGPTITLDLPVGESRLNVDFGLQGGNVPALRVVKRITNALRNGTPISGINFSQFVDVPTDPNDTAQWPSDFLRGVPNIGAEFNLQTSDEIEYTIYFLADGSQPAQNINICDQIPAGTTFVENSLEARLVNSPVQGRFIRPLDQNLPAGNACTDPANPNGSLILNLDSVPNNAGNNFGFIRFRVRL
jgi:uncharacterized repeat protein (TIGR01451 family)